MKPTAPASRALARPRATLVLLLVLLSQLQAGCETGQSPLSTLGNRIQAPVAAQITDAAWPMDLPEQWPHLAAERLRGDNRRDRVGRRLRIEWPGSPEDAVVQYEAALQARGYEVQRAELTRPRRALHAHDATDEAVLTFLPDANSTRVEILFIERHAG